MYTKFLRMINRWKIRMAGHCDSGNSGGSGHCGGGNSSGSGHCS